MGISDAEKQATLDEALNSETFSRSEQLRAFLRYVCKMESSGRGHELNEYLIAVEAFGRPRSFSPGEDSSVRTRAHELRQRLHRLYATECPDCDWQIELPKGSYVPRYVPRGAGVPPRPAPSPRSLPVRAWIWGAVLGLLATAAAAWLLPLRGARREVDPVLRQAWAPLLGKDGDILVSIASPLHLLVSPHMAVVPEDMPKFPAPQEIYRLFRRNRPLEPDAFLEMHPVQKSITMGDVQALVLITQTLKSLGAPFGILPESSSPLPAMRKRRAILIGSPWYSQAAATLLENTGWTTAVDPATRDLALIGCGKQTGKNFVPKRGPRHDYQEVFGLLSVLAGNPAPDDARTMLIFSGLTSVGSHGAADFFTSPKSLRAFLSRLKSDGIEGFPRSYQVVVRCRATEDTQMLSCAFETHHVLAR